MIFNSKIIIIIMTSNSEVVTIVTTYPLFINNLKITSIEKKNSPNNIKTELFLDFF